MRRSQDHLGAEPPSALARARPGVLAYRPSGIPRRVARSRELDGRKSAARRHQLGQHAGARAAVALVDVGAAFLRPRPESDRGRAPMDSSICCSALDRQLHARRTAICRTTSVRTHICSAKRSPCTSPAGRCRNWRASAATGRLGRRVLVEEIARQISLMAATASVQRTITATRSTSTCWRSPSPASRRDRPADLRARGRPARVGRARPLADDRGRMPHIGDDDGGALLPIAVVRPTISATTRFGCGAARPVGSARRAAAGGGLWLLAHPAFAPCSRSRRDVAAAAARIHRARRHRLLRLTLARLANTSSSTPGRTDTKRRTCTCGRPGAHASRPRRAAAHRSGNRLLHDRLAAARSLPLDGAAQHPDGRRALAVMPAAHSAGRARSTARVGGARRARFDYFDGAHDGYAPVVHRRHVLVFHGDLVIVADLVDGAGHHSADVHWHFGPGWTSRVLTEGDVARDGTSEPRSSFRRAGSNLFRRGLSGLGWHAPVYGRLAPDTTIRVRRTAALRTGSSPSWA